MNRPTISSEPPERPAARPLRAAAAGPLRRPALILAGIVLLLVGPTAPALAGVVPSAEHHPAPTTAARLSDALDRIVAAGAPGAVGYERRGGHVVEAAAGVADTATSRPSRAIDSYRIGSITKTLVATLTLQLIGRHGLRLDAPVARFLPGLLPDGATITVRELLNHTSGLYNYTDDPAFQRSLVAGASFTPRQLVAVANRHPLNFPPGTQYAYSNTDYIVLGLLARRIGEASLVAQLNRRILVPLGLRHTSLPTTRRELPRPALRGYIGGPSGSRTDITDAFSPTWAWAAGAVVSTVGDVAAFYRGLLSGRLLPAWALRAMKSTVPIGNGVGYGLGVLSVQLPCGVTAWGHDGLYPGYYNFALTSAGGDHQVVIAMNIDPENGMPPSGLLNTFLTNVVTVYCGS